MKIQVNIKFPAGKSFFRPRNSVRLYKIKFYGDTTDVKNFQNLIQHFAKKLKNLNLKSAGFSKPFQAFSPETVNLFLTPISLPDIPS